MALLENNPAHNIAYMFWSELWNHRKDYSKMFRKIVLDHVAYHMCLECGGWSNKHVFEKCNIPEDERCQCGNINKQETLEEFIKNLGQIGEFKPDSYYNADGDFIEFHSADIGSYVRSIDEYVDAIISIEAEKVIGFKIWGVSDIMKDNSLITYSVKLGRYVVEMIDLFNAVDKEIPRDSQDTKIYGRIEELALKAPSLPISVFDKIKK